MHFIFFSFMFMAFNRYLPGKSNYNSGSRNKVNVKM